MQVVLRPFHWRSTHPCKSPLYSKQPNIAVFLHIQGAHDRGEDRQGENYMLVLTPPIKSLFQKKGAMIESHPEQQNKYFFKIRRGGGFKITTLIFDFSRHLMKKKDKWAPESL